MAFTSRPYADVADLHKIQAATASWIASAGFCGYLHVGDIALRLFNGMRRYNPSDIIRLWEGANGGLVGWAFVCPPWQSYDALLHPAHLGGDLEGSILDWCEQQTAGWMQREGTEDKPMRVEVFEDDRARIRVLEARGYVPGKQPFVIGVRSLDDPTPDGRLPSRFSIRSVAGAHEADQVIEAMNASFDWSWTPDEYRRVIQSPGYPELLVVVAPDGRVASFCYLMLDSVNKLGMFEDVGTHPDFQRRGLARALLYEGMRRMKAYGMDTALVPHLTSLTAAPALYESVGFRPEYHLEHYCKAMEKSSPR